MYHKCKSKTRKLLIFLHYFKVVPPYVKSIKRLRLVKKRYQNNERHQSYLKLVDVSILYANIIQGLSSITVIAA